MTLSNNTKTILSKASKDAVKHNFSKIANNISNSKFVNDDNRYSKNTIKGIQNDIDTPKFKHKHMNEYIVSSILLHSMDAWSYCGRAVSSLLCGDVNVAKHLLYYSELRSSMSILAAQGIGVFDDIHFVLKSKDRCKDIRQLRMRTHVFAWEALDYWIESLNAVSTLEKVIYIENINLNKWLEKFGVLSSTKEAILKKFLFSLGFDLKLFKEDRNARNEVSYRPNTIRGSKLIDYQQILNEIKKCIQICEPTIGSGLGRIDELLLKRLIYISFKETNPNRRSAKQACKQFASKTKNMLRDVGLTDNRIDWWQNYLTNIDLTDEVFKYIDLYQDSKSDNYIFGMLFRALFLLRICSLFCQDYIHDNINITKDNLEFWWSNIGINAGLWKSSSEVTLFKDLWEDIRILLDDIDEILLNQNPFNPYSFQENNKIPINKLSSFERISLWSIGL